MDICFFFSYARPDCDKYLKRFFNDLVEGLAREGAMAHEHVCFKDIREIEPGDDWESHISEALQHSKVLVAIYSSRYFESAYCGKEFQVFIDRTPGASEDDTGRIRNVKNIVPIRWTPKTSLMLRGKPPNRLRGIQVLDPDEVENDDKNKRGLRSLLAKSGARGRYITVLEDLIQHILKLADNPLPRLGQTPSLQRVKSAFLVDSDPAPSTGQSEAGTSIGIGESHDQRSPNYDRYDFDHVAETAKGDRPLNLVTVYLTEKVDCWQPYIESDSKRIIDVLNELAINDGFEPVCPEIDLDQVTSGEIINVLANANSRNALPVLIIDPLLSERFQHLLQDIVASPRWHGGAMIPIDQGNLEAMRMLGKSQEIWNDGKEHENCEFIIALGSIDVLQIQFKKLLTTLKGRLLHNGRIPRQITGDGPLNRPILRGPGSRKRNVK